MGFLHKLWDETVAGPTPDSGLGKLRKYKSMSASRSSSVQFPAGEVVDPVSKSITVVRNVDSPRFPNLRVSVDPSSSIPSSSSSTPTTPRSPTTPDGSVKKLTRGKSTSAALQHGGSRTTNADYDWLVLNALDR